MNIINSKHVILLSCLFTCIDLKGQDKSILYNELHEPIKYANIQFYTADTTYVAGSVSDKNGMFPITRKKYSLAKISMLGYQIKWLPAPLPATIFLRSFSHKLNTVVVKSTSPIKMMGSSLVVNVQGSPYKDIGTADELLGQLPGVRADVGTYTVFGKGTAVIYVNNRRLRDNNELERISPKDISKVEVIRNPGAEYDANVPAVIKILLKRPISEGWGIQASTYGRLGRRFSDSETFAVNYTTSPVNIFFEAANSSMRMNTDQVNHSTIHSSNALWNMISDMPGWRSNYYNYTLTGGMNFIASSKHQAGTRWNYTNDTSRYGGATANTMFYNGLPFELLESQTISHSGYKQINGNVYYTGKFTNSFNLLLNSVFISRKAVNNEFTTEHGEKTKKHQNLSSGATDYMLWSGKLTGRVQAGKQLLFLLGVDGYLINQDRSNNNFDNGELYTQTKLKSQDINGALFTECSFSLSKLQTNIGLRYEITKMDYKNRLSNEQLLSKTFHSFYPYFSFSLSAGKVNMSLNYTSKVSRPSFYQLRNSREYFNRYLTTEGNPMLLPQYTSDISYTLQYKSFNTMIGYQRIKNYMQSKNIIVGQYPLNMIRRPINMPTYSGCYINLSYNKRVGFWHPYFSANLTKTFFSIKQDSKSIPQLGKSPFMGFSLSNWFYAGSWIFFADIRYDTNGYLREYHEYALTNVMLGVMKYFIKKSLYVSLQANGLLHSREKETSYNSNEVFEKSRYKDNQTVSLRIRYTLRYKNKYKGKSSATSELERM